ncbi:hypothetical protein L4D76_04705 [Photobacterium sagamiensis]|uniref:hypothetical protein n=1 Tax=Photobacterium sagamiensis TaxID=2910241 RepID=UPI003D0F5B64
MNSKSAETKRSCCDHGGKRPGCGRKPGIKTQPIRLPSWLLERLEQRGDARQLIIDACVSHYQLTCDDKATTSD